MNPNLLLTDHYQTQPLVQEFMDTDTKQTYIKNLMSDADFRARWMYRKVTYTTNSDHYRCPEWADISWNDSILVLGCSFAFGVGVDDSDTISSQLSSYLGGVPVVNLGQGGSSWTFQWINTVRLIKAGVRPRAVVYIWPDTTRYPQLINDRSVVHHGSWSADWKHSFGREYALDTVHADVVSRDLIDCIRLLWSCPQRHYYYAGHLDPAWAVEHLKILDRGRETMHPGPTTTRAWAEIIGRSLL